MFRLEIVDGTIYFHHQFIFEAYEIGNELFDGVLAAKFDSI